MLCQVIVSLLKLTNGITHMLLWKQEVKWRIHNDGL